MPVPSADPVVLPTSPVLQPPPAPLLGFSIEEFQLRRQALRNACPDGIIIVRGSTEDEAVNPGRFRQNSNFVYFTGVETPGAVLVMLSADLPASVGLRGTSPEAREILFLPARNPAGETWTGPKLGPGEDTEKATGIHKTADISSLFTALISWLRYNPVVHMPAPFGETAKLSRDYALMLKLAELAPVVQFRDITREIGKLRMVKSATEIERIAAAIDITHEGQRAARRLIASGAGRNECVVEAAIFEAFRSRGAGLAFGTIVGGGVNGTILHYEDNHDALNQGDLVVVDIGAKVGAYCGDITRTYPVGGVFGEREREIYSLVMEAHRLTISEYRVGETLQNLTDRCKAFYKASPLRSKDASGVEQTLDNFMPHGLSHHLGLDVHDVGDRENPLSPGHVITVEPGLYLPAEKIGVRIEDDYLVTENGLQRLGSPFESEPDEVEAAMRR